jgi:hypothetical protein
MITGEEKHGKVTKPAANIYGDYRVLYVFLFWKDIGSDFKYFILEI